MEQKIIYKSLKKSLLFQIFINFDQDVKASYKNGILKLNLLKKEEVIEKEHPKKVIEVI